MHETGTAANALCNYAIGEFYVIECGLPRALLGIDIVVWYKLPYHILSPFLTHRFLFGMGLIVEIYQWWTTRPSVDRTRLRDDPWVARPDNKTGVRGSSVELPGYYEGRWQGMPETGKN